MGAGFPGKDESGWRPRGGHLMANTLQNDVDLQHELWKACTLAIGVYGNLPGTPQTTPRATLTAFIVALQKTSGLLTVRPDSAYLVNGYHKARHRRPEGSNAELWHQIALEIDKTEAGCGHHAEGGSPPG